MSLNIEYFGDSSDCIGLSLVEILTHGGGRRTENIHKIPGLPRMHCLY